MVVEVLRPSDKIIDESLNQLSSLSKSTNSAKIEKVLGSLLAKTENSRYITQLF